MTKSSAPTRNNALRLYHLAYIDQPAQHRYALGISLINHLDNLGVAAARSETKT